MSKKLLPPEITLRYKRSNQEEIIIKNSTEAYNAILPFFPEHMIQLHEQFVVAYLNTAKKLLGVYVLSKGGITGTVADIRLILGVALKAVAIEIIIAHNHPSGNMKPSHFDECITKQLKDAARLMEIKLVDHLILGGNQFLSFSDEGIL